MNHVRLKLEGTWESPRGRRRFRHVNVVANGFRISALCITVEYTQRLIGNAAFPVIHLSRWYIQPSIF